MVSKNLFSSERLLTALIGVCVAFGSLISYIYITNIDRQEKVNVAINNRLYINEKKTVEIGEKLDNHLYYTVKK